MQDDDIIEIFLSFLSEREILQAYKQNINADNYKLKEFIVQYSPISWIDCAFPWDGTEEGTTFWSDIDSEWMSVVGSMRTPREGWKRRIKNQLNELYQTEVV